MIKKHAKDLIVLLIIAIVITVAILCMDIKTTDEYYAPTENKTETEQNIDGNEKLPSKNNQYVYMSIDCINLQKAIQKNNKNIKEEVLNYVPENGIIAQKQKIEINKGDTAYLILLKFAKQNKIHIDSDSSGYVKGINNISHFDGGGKSGWIYLVNGVQANVGASDYILQEGDYIEWRYTMDYGKDVGGLV